MVPARRCGPSDPSDPWRSNNDATGRVQSEITFYVWAGHEYYIAVGGNGGAEGGVHGGNDADRIWYASAPGPVSVDLGAGLASGEGNDTVVGVEHATGSRFDDIITGDGANNSLNGREGDDVVVGGAGNDRFRLPVIRSIPASSSLPCPLAVPATRSTITARLGVDVSYSCEIVSDPDCI